MSMSANRASSSSAKNGIVGGDADLPADVLFDRGHDLLLGPFEVLAALGRQRDPQPSGPDQPPEEPVVGLLGGTPDSVSCRQAVMDRIDGGDVGGPAATDAVFPHRSQEPFLDERQAGILQRGVVATDQESVGGGELLVDRPNLLDFRGRGFDGRGGSVIDAEPGRRRPRQRDQESDGIRTQGPVVERRVNGLGDSDMDSCNPLRSGTPVLVAQPATTLRIPKESVFKPSACRAGADQPCPMARLPRPERPSHGAMRAARGFRQAVPFGKRRNGVYGAGTGAAAGADWVRTFRNSTACPSA